LAGDNTGESVEKARNGTLFNVSNTMAKVETIQQYQTHAGDTGSSEVQIALLSERIAQLTGHLKMHPKDFHSRRGLIGLTSQRRKLLEYLKRKELNAYTALIQKLGLKR